MVEMMRNVRDGKGINHVDQTFEPQFELGFVHECESRSVCQVA